MAKRERRERYVLLGQYLDKNAAKIAEALNVAAVPHYTTRASNLTQSLLIGEWDVRIFLEQSSRDQAAEIAAGVVDA